ncbi:hypothetical protein [Billgrantia endophytica]|uniref:hypothetical protein n=1 Tax=Billgrantia endophytica TaxID=2033802 RepID=UPI00197A7260|nr:hypothetical protein [Halomonas endophytica]
MLRAAAEGLTDLTDLGLAAVHAHCRELLDARLAQPERARDDWSIPLPAALDGELGDPLTRFLESPSQQRLEWPLAQAKRQVIHQFIDRHELPMRHETRRSGRPFTLVLEKTRALFEREAAERRQWEEELAWLRRTQDRFTPPDPLPPRVGVLPCRIPTNSRFWVRCYL